MTNEAGNSRSDTIGGDEDRGTLLDSLFSPKGQHKTVAVAPEAGAFHAERQRNAAFARDGGEEGGLQVGAVQGEIGRAVGGQYRHFNDRASAAAGAKRHAVSGDAAEIRGIEAELAEYAQRVG